MDPRRHVDLGIAGYGPAEPIGSGGFGVVYRSWQERFGRMVAVKVLALTPDDAGRARFARECLALGRLSSHPNIVTLYDSGFTASGQPFLAMEHVPGGTVAADVGRNGAWPWIEAAGCAIRLAGAVETAHRAGILHRDIKPENVLLSEYQEPLLSDFGLARLQDMALSRSANLTTSLPYAAPEVLDGEPASAAADVYALGATLYMLLAGHAAFTRPGEEAVSAVMRRIFSTDVDELRPPRVAEDVWRVLVAAMAKEPRDRPGSALELGERLARAVADSGGSPPRMLVAGGPRASAARPERPPAPPPFTQQAPPPPSTSSPVAGREPAIPPSPPPPPPPSPPHVTTVFARSSGRPVSSPEPVGTRARDHEVPADPRSGSTARGRPSRRRMTWWLAGAAALVLLGTAGAATFLVLRSAEPDDPTSVVEAFMQAFDEGRCEDAAQYWRFDDTDERDDFLLDCAENGGDAMELSVEIGRVDEDPPPEYSGDEVVAVYWHGEARIDGDLETVEEGETAFVVARNGDRWRIVDDLDID